MICSAALVLLAWAIPVIWFDAPELIVRYLVFYLIPLVLLLLFEMRTSFGRQTSLWMGVALLTLGVASFLGGFGLAKTYPGAMEAQAYSILFLTFSAVPLIAGGIFLTLVPFRRRLAIVTYSVAFVLITPTIGLLMTGFISR